jgi:two-component system, chemotaxis family, CheB/CheR fusion protein
MSKATISIVGIGASAGALDAFHDFFANMPIDSGMAFIVIVRLPSDRKSLLPEFLSGWTGMRVVESDRGATIEANCVYVPPPHRLLQLDNGRLLVRMPGPDDQRNYRPIDSFFDVLCAAQREEAVGIVLSGTGRDGAAGVKSIKNAGGLTIAQENDMPAAERAQMPGEIAADWADVVARAEDIPAHLLRLRRKRPAASAPDEDSNQIVSVR